MPQMSPMDWFFMFIFFLIIYYIGLILVYFLMNCLFKEEKKEIYVIYISYTIDW